MRLGLILVAAVAAAGCGDDPGPAPVPTAPPPQATPTAPPAETAPTETQPAEQVPPIPESDDAAQPPSPELFFLFPAEEDARAAATELEQHGYRVRTAPPADDVPDWSVIAEGTPAGGDLKTAELAFRAWAEARDGRYDGNEIPVGP